MRIVHLAQGDFLMLGAFRAFRLFNLCAVNPIPTLAIAFTLFLLAGLPLYYLLVPRLLAARDPEMLSIILFVGFSQVIEAVATIAFGTSERSIPGIALGNAVQWVARTFFGASYEPGPVTLLGQSFPLAWVASGLASAVAVLFIYLYLYCTRLGYLTRAVMVSREEAISTGIDFHRVSAIAFAIAIALAAVAGIFAPFLLRFGCFGFLGAGASGLSAAGTPLKSSPFLANTPALVAGVLLGVLPPPLFRLFCA